MKTPEHIVLAEELGYRRAWCYDSPALYPDVWMILALAAARTSTIGLGPGVVVPSLRHPIVTAAAIGTLAAQAPGRVALAIGSGFTGRVVLGQKPMRWVDVAEYVRVLRALLAGEYALWQGHQLRMLQPPECGATRPVDVPILIGADGPKGQRVAAELGEGVFSANVPVLKAAQHSWRALLMWGTVLDDGEAPDSSRAISAVQTSIAVAYHVTYERGGAAAVDALPNGRRWREAIEAEPPDTRHLAIHAGHQIELNTHDEVVFPEAAELAPTVTAIGTAEQLRARLGAWAEEGVSEVAFQPAGPDIPRELTAFARMALNR
ncbi:MAG: LLM class flavin-dependent oxidoreductase [Mycobacteriaceae bacterium]